VYPCRDTSSRRDFGRGSPYLPLALFTIRNYRWLVIIGPAKKPLNVYRYEIKDGQLLLELKQRQGFILYEILLK
jgi:hypothetical protein